MSWKRIAFIVIGVVALAAVLIVNLGPKEPVRVEVQTERARRESIIQTVTASGKIRPAVEVKISADVGGYIRELTVREGDRVEAGQLLLQIDPEVYRAHVMEAQAAEQTTRARLTLAEASQERARGEAARVRGLFAKDLTSQANLEKATSDLAIAQAEVEAARGTLLQAQASLDRARKDLAKCTINSPIAGTIVLLNKESGERVSGGDFREDIVMTVADLAVMEVEVQVGERDVVLIGMDNPVDIEVDAYPGKTIPGRVTEVANAGVTRNQWTEAEVTDFRVVILVEQADWVLRPQMSATVRIHTARKEDALTVPIQSVTMRRPSEFAEGQSGQGAEAADGGAPGAGGVDGGAPERPVGPAGSGAPGAERRPQREDPVEVVFVVEDGAARIKPVKTGLSSDTRIEILEGLEKGAEVVSGPYRVLSTELKHGDRVRLAEPPGGKGPRRDGGPRRGPPQG